MNINSLLHKYTRIYTKEKSMPTITFRKVIRLGQNGLVITLPAGWVRYYNLKAGDRLEVTANKKLIVRPRGKLTIK